MIRRKTTAAIGTMQRNAVAFLALFVALGGSAYAAATIGPGDIETDAVRTRHIAAGHVVSSDIRNDTVRPADLGEGAVGTQAIRDGRVFSRDLAAGAVGDRELGTDSVGADQLGPIYVNQEERAIGFGRERLEVECDDEGDLAIGGAYGPLPPDMRVVTAGTDNVHDPAQTDQYIVVVDNNSGSASQSTFLSVNCLES